MFCEAYSVLKSPTSLRLKRTLLSPANNSRLLNLPTKPESLPTNLRLHQWPRPGVYFHLWFPNFVVRIRFRPSLRELRGAGDSGQDYMETDGHCFATRLGLGDERVGRQTHGGRWTLHKGCFLASLTTAFLLGLTCPFGFLLTWFAGKSIVKSACLRDTLPSLLTLPRSTCSVHYTTIPT